MGTHPIFESDFDCLTDCEIWPKWPEANRRAGAKSKSVRPMASNAKRREVFFVERHSRVRKTRRSSVSDQNRRSVITSQMSPHLRHLLMSVTRPKRKRQSQLHCRVI